MPPAGSKNMTVQLLASHSEYTTCKLVDFPHQEDVRKLTHDKQHPVMWGNFDNNLTIISW